MATGKNLDVPLLIGAVVAKTMIASAASPIDIADATFVSYSTNVSKLVVTATPADMTPPA